VGWISLSRNASLGGSEAVAANPLFVYCVALCPQWLEPLVRGLDTWNLQELEKLTKRAFEITQERLIANHVRNNIVRLEMLAPPALAIFDPLVVIRASTKLSPARTGSSSKLGGCWMKRRPSDIPTIRE
jgi:hypothetical protein